MRSVERNERLVQKWRRHSPPLTSDELAFYDSLATNESALTIPGEGVLAQVARDLCVIVRRDVKTDWTVPEHVRAELRSSLKRLLVNNRPGGRGDVGGSADPRTLFS